MNKSLAVGVSLVASGIIGGLVGGLLAAYWWDFPPEDMERYGTETIVLYSFLGAICGLIVGGLLIAIVSAVLEVRGSRRRRTELDVDPLEDAGS